MTAPALFATAPSIPDGTVTNAAVPDLTDYDVITVNISGGKDSWPALWATMEAARTAGVADRVQTFHATLGLMEWPAVTYGGRDFESVSQLAARQSAAAGIPAERHREAGRCSPEDNLLTYIAAYGCFPRLGTRFCTKAFKEQVEEKDHTPQVQAFNKEVGRELRRLKVFGLRSEESPNRAARPVYRHVLRNGARWVDEWSPVKDWTIDQVWGLHADTGMPWHWTYDSRPGAGDRQGTSRCSCSFCVLSAQRDTMIAIRRRPRLAELYALVENTRGDTFAAGMAITTLIERAHRSGAPDPGIEITESPEFDALDRAVRAALANPPRKEPRLAAKTRARLNLPLLPMGDGCS